MGKLVRRLAIALLILGVIGCAGTPSSAPTQTASSPPATVVPTDEPTSGAGAYGGVLRSGFACAAISPDHQPPWPSPAWNLYELRLPDGYTTTIGPVAIFGPDGQKIAGEGERIEVVGTFPGTPGSTCLEYVLEATQVIAARS
jgi:hypothetical protein